MEIHPSCLFVCLFSCCCLLFIWLDDVEVVSEWESFFYIFHRERSNGLEWKGGQRCFVFHENILFYFILFYIFSFCIQLSLATWLDELNWTRQLGWCGVECIKYQSEIPMVEMWRSLSCHNIEINTSDLKERFNCAYL
jgi:hypothetical protein